MAQAIRSVLFFDYDSLYRSLNSRVPTAGDQLGSRAGAWIDAIESGSLMTPPAPGFRRRLEVRRVYADPRTLGKNRGWLAANGLQIVDCPVLAGSFRSPADVHIVLDAVDALERVADFDEFILLSAEIDLTPLLLRLRAHNRRIVTYSGETTAASYRAFADASVSENAFLDLLGRPADGARRDPLAARIEERARAQARIPPPPERSMPAPAAAPVGERPRAAAVPSVALPVRPVPTAGPVDREALAALVRRIHQATSVPLFSPRAFSDLFRELAEEVRDRGYRFQQTTENVTARMAATGRSVAKRQVGFVVKGLALKGHVFAPDDTPERLARAFHEQVLYLVGTAGVGLTEAEQALVAAWITGGTPTSAASPPPPAAPFEPRRPGEREIPPPPRRPPAERPGEVPRPVPPPSLGRPLPGSSEFRPPGPAASPLRPGEPLPRPVARPAGGTRELPGLRAVPGFRPEAVPPRPSAVPWAPPGVSESGPIGAEMEDSILAAIAEAVDVAVDEPADPAEGPAEPAPSGPEDGDDIGDEIQRILASYQQDRS